MKEKISFKDFISGHILIKGFNYKHAIKIALIVFLSMFYIGNTYRTVEIMYDIAILQKEISILRNRSIDYTVKLQEMSREHEVKRMLKEKNIGLISKQSPIVEIAAE